MVKKLCPWYQVFGLFNIALIGLCRKKIGHNGNSIEKSLHDILFVLLIDLRVLQSLGQNKRHVKILWQIIGEKEKCKIVAIDCCCQRIFTSFSYVVSMVLLRLVEIVLWTFFFVVFCVSSESFHCKFQCWFSVDRARLCSSFSLFFCSFSEVLSWLLFLCLASDEFVTWI